MYMQLIIIGESEVMCQQTRKQYKDSIYAYINKQYSTSKLLLWYLAVMKIRLEMPMVSSVYICTTYIG